MSQINKSDLFSLLFSYSLLSFLALHLLLINCRYRYLKKLEREYMIINLDFFFVGKQM